MKIFLICPVRGVKEEENRRIVAYVAKLESEGNQVYWPYRDTDQNDNVGLRICTDNCVSIAVADQVHVWWNDQSQGSIFDFGMAFALHKTLVLANPESIKRTSHKSFANVIATYAQNSSEVM